MAVVEISGITGQDFHPSRVRGAERVGSAVGVALGGGAVGGSAVGVLEGIGVRVGVAGAGVCVAAGGVGAGAEGEPCAEEISKPTSSSNAPRPAAHSQMGN